MPAMEEERIDVVIKLSREKPKKMKHRLFFLFNVLIFLKTQKYWSIGRWWTEKERRRPYISRDFCFVSKICEISNWPRLLFVLQHCQLDFSTFSFISCLCGKMEDRRWPSLLFLGGGGWDSNAEHNLGFSTCSRVTPRRYSILGA